MKRVFSITLFSLAIFGGSVANNVSSAQPFGNAEEVKYSAQLWNAMAAARLVGSQAIAAVPYKGAVHKNILITLDSTVRVGDHTGAVIVKKMFQGDAVTVETVANNPTANLKIVAVMFKRKTGYDADHRDWFYVKFNPDGTPQTNPKGVSLAGQVPKCRSCHQAAPGGDYVYSYDR